MLEANSMKAASRLERDETSVMPGVLRGLTESHFYAKFMDEPAVSFP